MRSLSEKSSHQRLLREAYTVPKLFMPGLILPQHEASSGLVSYSGASLRYCRT